MMAKKQDNRPETQGKFNSYISDFYYAFGILFLLIAAFFMFNEPVGASMLSFDMSVLLVVFATVYAVGVLAKNQIVSFLGKYLFLLGLVITAFQFMIDYGTLSLLQLFFFVTVVLFVINFIFDFLMYIPMLWGLIWDSVKRFR